VLLLAKRLFQTPFSFRDLICADPAREFDDLVGDRSITKQPFDFAETFPASAGR
jgi:hypothetical protein